MISKLLSELRDKPRLRWGVLLILGTCWLYGVLMLGETLQAELQHHRTAAQSLARLRAQLAQPEWPTRLLPAKTMAVQLEGRLWQAATTGLAQAAFQDWLNSAMLQAGIQRPKISVTVVDESIDNANAQSTNASATGPGVTTASGLWKTNARLNFEASTPVLLQFLKQIESFDKQAIVTKLNIQKDTVTRVDVEIIGYFQKAVQTVQTSAQVKPDKTPVPQ